MTTNIDLSDLEAIADDRDLNVTISQEGNQIVLDWGSHKETFTDAQEACDHLRAM